MDSEHPQKRVSLACEACRKRKRKCDGTRPVCSSCNIQRKECLWESQQDVTRKRKRNIDYVLSLEDQLTTLKSYVADLEKKISALNGSTSRLSAIPFPDLDDEATTGLRDISTNSLFIQDQDHRLTAAIDEVGSMMWKMSISEAGNPSFIGPSGNFCFATSPPPAKVETCKIAKPLIDKKAMYAIYMQDEKLINELSELFTNHINTFHQFVPQAALVPASLDAADPVSRLLQCAMLAAAARYLEIENAEQIGDCFAMSAESLALQCTREFPSLAVVQALTIMCWRELSLENENMGWMYNSMASSLCTHMGLHAGALEVIKSDQQSLLSVRDDQNDRIQTFWQFFLIDRMATSMLGRMCTIPWKRVMTSSFQSILNPEAPLCDVAFDHQCKLWLLHDQFMDQIYSFEFSKLSSTERNKLLVDARESLIMFHQDIDDRLRYSKTITSEYTICFQMSYQMSLLLIHRPYLREPPNSNLHRLALRSMTAAASTMSSLIRAYRKLESFARAPFYVVHHIHTAAIMHLLSATSSQATLRQQSITRFRICVEALEDLQCTWPRARKSIRLVQELAKRWSVVFALPMRLSNVLDIADPASHVPEPAPIELAHDLLPESFPVAPNERWIQESNIGNTLSGWEEYIPLDTEGFDSLCMDSAAFNDLTIPNDTYDNLRLDWLFAP